MKFEVYVNHNSGSEFVFEKIVEASSVNKALDMAYPEVDDHKRRYLKKIKEKKAGKEETETEDLEENNDGQTA